MDVANKNTEKQDPGTKASPEEYDPANDGDEKKQDYPINDSRLVSTRIQATRLIALRTSVGIVGFIRGLIFQLDSPHIRRQDFKKLNGINQTLTCDYRGASA